MRTRHSHQTILCRGKWLVVRVERRAIPRVAPAPVAQAPKAAGTLRFMGGAIAEEVAYLLRNQPLRMPSALWRPDA